jgi:hypothetical protein
MKMKKLLFIIAIGFVGMTASAQTSSKSILIDGVDINKKENVEYIELLFTQKFMSFKVRCVVDYGQEFEWGSDTRVQGSDGVVKNFNSVIDGLNYFVNNGWVFVGNYPVTMGTVNVYHYLLKRENSK